MIESLAENIPFDVAATKPNLELVEIGGQTTPRLGALALVPTSREDCMLADVDDLHRYRREDGTYDPKAVKSIKQNKVTGVKEGAIPFAVSDVSHDWEPLPEGIGGVIRDLGRTAVQTAIRGREIFYRFPESKARGFVEVDYARYNQENLCPGRAHVMIAAKMTSVDASPEVAKAEGLDLTDSIQVNWLPTEEGSEPAEAKTSAILVPDVSSEDWADMLADPDNIFGKAISVSNRHSGLAIMQAFSQLDLPLEKLPEGPITIVAAVLPYIKDPIAREKVSHHLEKFRGDQAAMDLAAQNPAERWTKFDMATEASLVTGLANAELQAFIESLEDMWGDKDRAVIEAHRMHTNARDKYRMTRKLAAVLQNAQRNFILTAAAVVTNNEKVLAQMSPSVAKEIYRHEMELQVAYSLGLAIHNTVFGDNNRLIASQNITVGGGCLGENEARFRVNDKGGTETEGKEVNSWHGGRIKKGRCVNCNEKTFVGVKSWCQKCISGHCGSKKK